MFRNLFTRKWCGFHLGVLLLLFIGVANAASSMTDDTSFSYIFKIEDLIVKPLRADKGQYVFLNVAFEVKKRDNLKTLQKLSMKLRRGISSLIKSKTVRQLDSPADKQRLRNEIFDLVEPHLARGELVDVYFIDYIIQTVR